MVQIETFAVERWMDEYETTPGVLNISETCAASISINELCQLSTDKNVKAPFDHDQEMVYGAIRGSSALRRNIAALCSDESSEPLSEDNVIIMQGAIGANFLAMYSLVGPGDHVVCVYPTYQQLYAVPKSLGAEVSLWELRKEDGFVPNLKSLEGLLRDNTKMIVINNPNNPTGAPIPEEVLRDIAKIAESRGIVLFSDEVYRPLFHSMGADNKSPPAATSLGYKRTLVTGSMSKAFALAGLRIGWVVSRDKSLLDTIASTRDYTTISVSQLDDKVAAFALSPAVQPSLLERNMKLAQKNLELLSSFVDKYQQVCSWNKPQAGTTAFICFKKNGQPVVDTDFCIDVLKKTKVFLVPGSYCFGGGKDFPGYVRLGYVSKTDVLTEALEKLGKYVEEHLM